MKTNETEVKIIMNEFNSISNRLMQAAYSDYLDVLRKFFNYIESNELIMEFINNCGGFCQDMEDMFDDIIAHKRRYFKFSIDDNEEAAEIYSVIKILCSREYNEMPPVLFMSYSSSNKFSDNLKEFNHRVVFILISHISDFLKKVGIEMGLDNNGTTYNINGTQVNIANDNANINAVQNNNGINSEELKKFFSNMREQLKEDLNCEDENEANECIDVIESEFASDQPDEEVVKSTFKHLKRIDGSVKFASACCALLNFADKLYPFLDKIIPFFQNI